ncbi:hypothetical protein CFP56_036883 [Quercus suber]|uniref:Uncharacterized protein n=1 Tax=Quercus suber TaxID=58331 RepID=A0AAW0LR73_QUESU
MVRVEEIVGNCWTLHFQQACHVLYDCHNPVLLRPPQRTRPRRHFHRLHRHHRHHFRFLGTPISLLFLSNLSLSSR